MLKLLASEFKSSIKSPDTEEKLDLIFYRPLGFLIAKVGNYLRLSPTNLTILGLISGIVAAVLFFEKYWSEAIFLFLLSGIFDSSDGQLARISGKSSKIGLILDGICDSLVTIAIYTAGIIPFIHIHGYWVIALAFWGLFFHSSQCAILDFYHREYLYFGYGKTDNDTYWNPSNLEMQEIITNSSNKIEQFFNKLRVTWIKQQQVLTTRSDKQRKFLKAIVVDRSNPKREILLDNYKRLNKPILPFWRLIGTNAHTILIIIFFIIGRFDLYLLLFDYIILNLLVLIITLYQKKLDSKLLIILGHEER